MIDDDPLTSDERASQIERAHNQAVEVAARIAETLVKTRNVDAKTGHVTNIRRGASGQEIADEIRRQLLRKA